LMEIRVGCGGGCDDEIRLEYRPLVGSCRRFVFLFLVVCLGLGLRLDGCF